MNGSNQQFSRAKNKRKKRENQLLNILIAFVIIGIIITAYVILKEPNDDAANEQGTTEQQNEQEHGGKEHENSEQETAEDDDQKADDDAKQDDVQDNEADEADEIDESDQNEHTDVEEVESDDPVVEKSIVNSKWEAVGTEQQGEHASSYEKNSVDWNEKIKAMHYATNLSDDDMIVLWLKNGGGPDKSIGIVQSNDSSEKYRIYLQWIDGEGWKPEKVDVLNTLDFNYK